jgi:hypothetical protein
MITAMMIAAATLLGPPFPDDMETCQERVNREHDECLADARRDYNLRESAAKLARDQCLARALARYTTCGSAPHCVQQHTNDCLECGAIFAHDMRIVDDQGEIDLLSCEYWWERELAECNDLQP